MVRTSFFQRFSACTALLWLLISVHSANGADIAYKVEQGRNTSFSLELGMQYFSIKALIVGFAREDPNDPTATDRGLRLLIDSRAEWRGLFAELFTDSFSGVALGYALWESEYTKTDLMITEGLGEYNPGSDPLNL